MMTEARSAESRVQQSAPRQTYATVDSATIQALRALSTITSAALAAPADGTWNGAKMAVISGAWMGRM